LSQRNNVKTEAEAQGQYGRRQNKTSTESILEQSFAYCSSVAYRRLTLRESQSVSSILLDGGMPS